MKSLKYFAALALVLPLALVSCRKEKEDTTENDEPFTITANLPEDTAETDLVYIVGEFNGGEEFALGNPKWELKGTATKRSVTIDPKDYIGGKTIDDFWWIQSPTRGVEVVSPDVPMVRQGKSTEINLVAWENHQIIIMNKILNYIFILQCQRSIATSPFRIHLRIRIIRITCEDHIANDICHTINIMPWCGHAITFLT